VPGGTLKQMVGRTSATGVIARCGSLESVLGGTLIAAAQVAIRASALR
jgi:hypothetical protein